MQPTNILSKTTIQKVPRPDMASMSGLTPDSIMNMLFQLHSEAHYYHLQTTSFAQHKMLDELYEAMEDHKDTICEFLLGIQAPQRFGSLIPHSTADFTPEILDMFLRKGKEFSMQLIAYGKTCNQEQLSNLASDMCGSFVKALYLNTLK